MESVGEELKGPSHWAGCQIILVCTFFPISVSKRQRLHASKYLHDDAVMEERLTISLGPNPHTYSQAILAIFNVSSN